MKIKLPEIKRNKKHAAANAGTVTFDLTGGSGNATSTAGRSVNSASSSAGFGVPESVVSGGAASLTRRRLGRRHEKSAGTDSQNTVGSLGIPGAGYGSGPGAIGVPGAGAGSGFGVPGTQNADAFAVNVRNSEPIIRRLESRSSRAAWLGDLKINIPAAGLIMVMLSTLLSVAYIPEIISFALPCIAVFMLITSLESLGRERIRLYTCIGIAVVLVVLLVILRRYIGGGWAIIMNQLYDSAEEAQAYVYDRLQVGTTGADHPNRSMHLAMLWGSALLGLLAALPPIRVRRTIVYVLSAITMIALAYYGLVPSGICAAVLAVILIIALTRGHLLSSLPVLLIAMLIFGAVMLIDPGENYGISRADENFRDRFALISAYLESDTGEFDDMSGFEDDEWDLDNETGDQDNSESTSRGGAIVRVLVMLAVVAAIAAAAGMFIRRLRQRQAKNREGIDSADPRQAIVAMFPYAVRWLQPAGIEAAGQSFASLVPSVRREVSEYYADRYSSMYELWKVAAYSDHDISEGQRSEMRAFLQDTQNMVRNGSNLRKRIVNTIRYAL